MPRGLSSRPGGRSATSRKGGSSSPPVNLPFQSISLRPVTLRYELSRCAQLDVEGSRPFSRCSLLQAHPVVVAPPQQPGDQILAQAPVSPDEDRVARARVGRAGPAPLLEHEPP